MQVQFNMQLLQRHIAWQIARLVIVITAATFLIAVFTRIKLFIDSILEDGTALAVLFKVIVLLAPSMLVLLLPITLFVAVLGVYLRAAGDNETGICRAAGLSNLGLALPSLSIGVAATIIAYVLSLYLLPISFKRFKDLEFEIIHRVAALALRDGTFNEIGNGLMVYLRERKSDGTYEGILIRDQRPDRKSSTILAESARLLRTPGQQLLILSNGSRQEQGEKPGQVHTVQFEELNVDLGGGAVTRTGRGIAERHIGELLNPSPVEIPDAQLRQEMVAEAHSRISSPIYCLGMALLAAALVLYGAQLRRQAYLRAGAGIAFAFLLQLSHLGLVSLATSAPALIWTIYANALLPLFIGIYLIWLSDHHAAGRDPLAHWLKRAATGSVRRLEQAEPS